VTLSCVTRGCGDHSPLMTAAILEWRRRSAWGWCRCCAEVRDASEPMGGHGVSTLQQIGTLLFDVALYLLKRLWAGFIRKSRCRNEKQRAQLLLGVSRYIYRLLELNMLCDGIYLYIVWCLLWCLLFVLIRQGLRGGSGPQRFIGIIVY